MEAAPAPESPLRQPPSQSLQGRRGRRPPPPSRTRPGEGVTRDARVALTTLGLVPDDGRQRPGVTRPSGDPSDVGLSSLGLPSPTESVGAPGRGVKDQDTFGRLLSVPRP